MVEKTHFQPGRYEVNLDTVRPRAQAPRPFEGYLGREKKPANRDPMLSPPGMGVTEGPYVPDRSLFRLSPSLSTTRRVLSVSNMREDLDRPNMFTRVKPTFDTTDPAVCEQVHAWQMSFDRSAVETSQMCRTDQSPRFDNSLARCAAGLGARIFQQDIGMRRMRQLKGDLPSTTSEAFLRSRRPRSPGWPASGRTRAGPSSR